MASQVTTLTRRLHNYQIMTSPSKAKGNSFERHIADFLTELYGEKFMRAPGSGAYIGGKNTHRKQLLHEGQIRSFKGDIIPGESFPRLNAECKSYKEFPFHQLFSSEVKMLEGWIEQCMDVSDHGDFNIIFMKFNRKGQFVVFQEQQPYSTLNPHVLHLYRAMPYYSDNHGNWYIMDHDKFWGLNKNIVKQLCK